MKVYNYSEARQNFATILNTALKEEVIIARKDGSKFRLISVKDEKKGIKSPLENIKGIKAGITMDEILDAIKENGTRSLGILKSNLPEEVRYFDIQYYIYKYYEYN